MDAAGAGGPQVLIFCRPGAAKGPACMPDLRCARDETRYAFSSPASLVAFLHEKP